MIEPEDEWAGVDDFFPSGPRFFSLCQRLLKIEGSSLQSAVQEFQSASSDNQPRISAPSERTSINDLQKSHQVGTFETKSGFKLPIRQSSMTSQARDATPEEIAYVNSWNHGLP